MKTFTVQVSDAEEKALSTIMIDIREWMQNAISNRARQAIDTIIQEQTDRQPRKMSVGDKKQLISIMKLKTAVEINAESEAELMAL